MRDATLHRNTEQDRQDERVWRYQDALDSLPESGGGGCHAALLGVANLGVRSGLSNGQIFDDLRGRAHGSRRVPDSEIQHAIRKARIECLVSPMGDKVAKPYIPPRARERTSRKTLQQLLDLGHDSSEADIWEASPIRIDWPPAEDSWQVLSFLYSPDEILFAGTGMEKATPGNEIRTASEWQDHFRAGGEISPHVIPNPLTGEEGRTKTGEPSYRADSCIGSYRFAVVEFDGLTRDQQIAFWTAIKLPVAALIDSGGKSIHGWVRVDSEGREAWERDVEQRLYAERLIPLGVDPTCRNEARLSRLPGHRRTETGRCQRVLYLAPEGRPINE